MSERPAFVLCKIKRLHRYRNLFRNIGPKGEMYAIEGVIKVNRRGRVKMRYYFSIIFYLQ